MAVYGEDIPRRINLGIELHVSDIQALRKIVMMAGHSHKTQPCNICHIEHDDINRAVGYDIESMRFQTRS